MVAAGGIVFSAGQDAAAYSNRAGYSYTQRVCQEYGLPPRQYWVRDEIAGSDWRSSGGWAIILEGGTNAGPWLWGNAIVGTSLTDGNIRQFYLGAGGIWPAYRYTSTNSLPNFTSATLPQQKLVVDNSGGDFNGRQGLIEVNGNGLTYLDTVWIDQNGDGNVNAADKTAGPGDNQYERALYRARTIYGGSYIRWADMRWCR